VSVTATLVAAEDDGSFGTAPFVESLVMRLHAEYGVDRDRLRRLATEVLGTFATARVQAFVPILVEKRLRETCRALRDRCGTPPSAMASDGWPAGIGRHRR
jgi:hypothetical protein